MAGSSDQEIRSASTGSSSSINDFALGTDPYITRRNVTSRPNGANSQRRNPNSSHHASNSFLATLLLAYSSIGVIFGDIGTSPIYAYRVIFSILEPNEAYILGATSLIIWSFFFIVIIKYLIIVLSADDDGEGGSFAVYSTICRHLRLNANGEKLTFHDEMDRQLTTYSDYESKHDDNAYKSSILKRSKIAQFLLLLLTLFSAALVIGDGVLTPAVSVLSSVEGLVVQVESLSPLVIPFTCFMLLTVFFIQSFGTHNLSSTFSPAVALWLFSNATVGCYNIIRFAPTIFKTLSPHYALLMIYNAPRASWLSLQGVLLCITGAEALFADMGHFSRNSVRLATLVVVLPSLSLTYLGQASFILKFPSSIQNPYWLSIPKLFYWPLFVLSLLVTIIASQALISASFSIIHQAISINCFPPIRIYHTSKKVYGQIYAPALNYGLMCLSIATVLLFKESIRLLKAYGVAVSIVMSLSTISLSIVMYKVWEFHWAIVCLFTIAYAFIDGSFLTSNLLKTKDWGWYTIAVSVLIVSLMGVWRWGKLLSLNASSKRSKSAKNIFKGLLEVRQQYSSVYGGLDTNKAYRNWNTFNNAGELFRYTSAHIAKNTMSVSRFNSSTPRLKRHMSQTLDCQMAPQNSQIPGLAKILGMCIFYTNQHGKVPPLYYQYLETFPVVFSITIFLHVRRTVVPYVPYTERLRVLELRYEGFYSIVATYGYMDAIELGEKLASNITDALKSLEIINYRDELEYIAMINRSEIAKSSANHIPHSSSSNNIPTAQELRFDDSVPPDPVNPTTDPSPSHEPASTTVQSNVPNSWKRTVNSDHLAINLNMRINHIVSSHSTGVTYIVSENHLFCDKRKLGWGIFKNVRKYLIESVFYSINLMTVSTTTIHNIPFNRSVVLNAKLEG